MMNISTIGILRNLSFENDACRAEIAAQKGIEALLEVGSIIRKSACFGGINFRYCCWLLSF